MPRPVDSHQMKRLALVKQLHRMGVYQTRQQGPSSALGLLSLHDAVEMYLQILCDLWDVSEKRPDFLGYITLLRTGGLELVGVEGMKRLNTARIGLKHHGILPAAQDVEALRAATTNFLQDNCPTAVGVDFGAISLTSAVGSKHVRDLLEAAEVALASSDLKEALEKSAIAFEETLKAHNHASMGPISQIQPYSARSAALEGATEGDARRLAGALDGDAALYARRLGEAVIQSAEVFGEAITVVGYGLDFRRFANFKTFAPGVIWTASGSPRVNWLKPVTADQEAVRGCVDFAIEAAVQLAPVTGPDDQKEPGAERRS